MAHPGVQDLVQVLVKKKKKDSHILSRSRAANVVVPDIVASLEAAVACMLVLCSC